MALHRNKEPRSPNRCAHGKPTKSGFPLPIDTAWVPASRNLPLLRASSFGNDFWQPVYTLVECAKRKSHNPEAWLTDVLTNLPAMTNQDDLTVLLPSNWQPATAANPPLRVTSPP